MVDVVPCTLDDTRALARMNRMLIEDEKADNPMALGQLEQRMAGFLRGDYRAYLFLVDGAIVGYALVNMAMSPFYLRQFYIRREERRKGYGTAAFRTLVEYLDADAMDIEVYVWNEAGIAFWQSLGFAQRCYSMRFRR